MASVIATDALLIAMDRMYKSSPTYSEPSVFKVGVDQTTALVGDTDLDHPVAISGTESVDDCDATTSWTDSADMTIALNTTTFKEGTGSLSLAKDGTASAKASTIKTTTSRDFTSKEFHIWIYVNSQGTLDKFATTDCLTIRFGSDSSNYSQWTKDKSFFSVGWNLVDLLTTTNRDSQTGTHDLANSDFTFIQLTATGSGDTWAADEVLMDDIKLVSSGDYTKTLTSGFPSIDESTKEVTFRAELSSVEANGYLLNGFGIFNTDGTPKLDSIDDFMAESKTNTDNFIFTTKNTFTLV